MVVTNSFYCQNLDREAQLYTFLQRAWFPWWWRWVWKLPRSREDSASGWEAGRKCLWSPSSPSNSCTCGKKIQWFICRLILQLSYTVAGNVIMFSWIWRKKFNQAQLYVTSYYRNILFCQYIISMIPKHRIKIPSTNILSHGKPFSGESFQLYSVCSHSNYHTMTL